MKKKGYVYILTNKVQGTLYIGVTSDLVKRVFEHKQHIYKGFTQKYDVIKLVWFEEFNDIEEAIYREKQMKKWNRNWKIRLINEFNDQWKDLYNELL